VMLECPQHGYTISVRSPGWAIPVGILSPRMSKCWGEGWGDVRLEGGGVNDCSWGFVYSRVRGEKKSLEKKFVLMKKYCQMGSHVRTSDVTIRN
jgi:hypothetical protein